MLFLSLILFMLGYTLIGWALWGMPEAVNEARYRKHAMRLHERAEERSLTVRERPERPLTPQKEPLT